MINHNFDIIVLKLPVCTETSPKTLQHPTTINKDNIS